VSSLRKEPSNFPRNSGEHINWQGGHKMQGVFLDILARTSMTRESSVSRSSTSLISSALFSIALSIVSFVTSGVTDLLIAIDTRPRRTNMNLTGANRALEND